MNPSRASNKHRYRKVAMRMWGDENFSSLSALPPSGQSLWLYLLTCPLPDSIPGVYRAGRASLSESIGWEIDEFDRCFEEISALGMARADWKAKLVWLPNAAKYNPPESPNVVIFWSKAWAEIPECAMKVEIYHSLKTHICAIGKGFADAFEQNFTQPVSSGGDNRKPNKDGATKTLSKDLTKASPKASVKTSPKASAKTSTKASTKASADVLQGDEQSVGQPEKPNKDGACEGFAEGFAEDIAKGMPNLELELELELEQEHCGEKGGLGERSSAGPSPSAPAPHESAFSFESKAHEQPQGQQGEIDGTGWQPPSGGNDLRDMIRENQRERGTRLPADYVVSENWLLQARKVRPDLPVDQVKSAAASFVGYWSAKPGKDGLKLNWFSAWLNWVRKEQAWSARGSARTDQPRLLPPSGGAPDPERERKMREFQARYPGARFVNRPASKPDG